MGIPMDNAPIGRWEKHFGKYPTQKPLLFFVYFVYFVYFVV